MIRLSHAARRAITIHTRGSIIPAILVASVVGVAGCSRSHADDAAGPPPTQIGPENITVVTQGTAKTGPVISGTLAPVRNAQLRAQVGGSVLKVLVEQGQHVTANESMAQIDDAAIQDALLSARSAYNSAQIAANYAARQASRYDTLFNAGAVSDRDREAVLQANAQAQAGLSDAKARLVAAEKNLTYTAVRAPFSGVVADRDVSAGDVVQPGTLLYTVVDPSELQLRAAVPAEEIAAVRVGQAVSFTLNGAGDRLFTGTVRRMSPLADPSTRQVEVYATMPNPGNSIVAGLYASGRIVTDSATGLLVPTDAIDTRALHPVVERLRGGRVERLDVKLGVRDAQADRVQIVAGVALGDTLLRGAAQAMDAGSAVRVVPVGDTRTTEK